MPFSQSRFRRFPIPFPAFPNPAPAFSSDGSGSASFYRCAPAAALPHSRPGRFFLSPPPGFSPIPFLAFSNPTSDLSARTAAGLPVLLSRPGRFPIPPRLSPIPFLAFPNPAPAFSSDGSGSASFYRFAPAAALPHSRPGRFFPTPLRLFPQSRFGRFFPTPLRRLSAPHGKRFSGGGPAGVPAWNPQALLPCAGGGPTRLTQTRPPVRPCGSGQAPKTRPPSAGGRLLYVLCGSRQKALPPRDGGRRAPPLGPSSSSPLRTGLRPARIGTVSA